MLRDRFPESYFLELLALYIHQINEPWECDGDDTPATSVTGVDTDRQRPFLSSRVDAGFVLHDCVEPLMKKMVAAGKEKRPNDDGGR